MMSSDVIIYWTMTGTHVAPDRQQQYNGNTPIISCLVHIQPLHGILYTTTSRPNTNTSPITLYQVFKFQSFFSFWIACDIPNIEVDTKEQVARHNQPSIYILVYIRKQTKYSDPIPTTSGESMNKYDPSNYNCCINNTTAVWNLTPPPVNIALIPEQHVIHQASKYQSRYNRYR